MGQPGSEWELCPATGSFPRAAVEGDPPAGCFSIEPAVRARLLVRRRSGTVRHEPVLVRFPRCSDRGAAAAMVVSEAEQDW
jgi:hypothetical protein